MIKLIASDLDGTLLDPAGNLPEATFSAIEKLYKNGTLFCAASGRQLAGLRQLFAPVADKILLIAENGAIVAHADNIFACSSIPRENITRALSAIKTLRRAHPLLCTPDRAYYEEAAQPFLQFVQASYISNAQAKLAEIAANETVCKIAVYDESGPESDGMLVLPAALPDMRVIQSGGNWLDISERDANKGNAMRMIQEHLHLSPEECMAFGDHMNDYELLLACGHPYVTDNAYPGLKQRFSSVVASNADEGVLQAMLSVAEGKLPEKLDR